jgi:protein TonB
MTNKALFIPSSPLPNNDSLLVALFGAAIVHVVLILGMNFTLPQPDRIHKSIDITLVDTPAKKAPPKANFLAQESQVGAGEEAKKPEPPAQKLPSQGDNSQAKLVKKAAPEESKPKTAPEKNKPKAVPEESKPKAAPKIITRPKVEKAVVTASKPKPDVVTRTETPARPRITAESLQQQLAQLGTEIRQSRPSSEQSRIKFVEAVSAHKYIAAQYMKDWESKVERTGNLNYPEAAAKKNFSGTLTMDVGIKADGSIYSIRITRSSGNLALDEAAKNIVRMSAPFAPLPLDLRKELEVLVITRVWKFSDESGLITR